VALQIGADAWFHVEISNLRAIFLIGLKSARSSFRLQGWLHLYQMFARPVNIGKALALFFYLALQPVDVQRQADELKSSLRRLNAVMGKETESSKEKEVS